MWPLNQNEFDTSGQLEQATEQPDALNTLAIITVMHTELYRNKLNK